MSIESQNNKIELASAFLISLAALLTAWCGFESSRWSSVETLELAEENRKGSMAMEKTLDFNQYMMFDGILAVNFMNATVEGKQHLLDFYLQRLRPDMKHVMKQWLESKPLENPEAYPHPLAQPDYKKFVADKTAEMETLRKEAGAHRAAALKADKVADTYLLLTILFSAVMFLGGIESKFNQAKVRIALIVFAGVLFVFAIYRLLIAPVV